MRSWLIKRCFAVLFGGVACFSTAANADVNACEIGALAGAISFSGDGIPTFDYAAEAQAYQMCQQALNAATSLQTALSSSVNAVQSDELRDVTSVISSANGMIGGRSQVNQQLNSVFGANASTPSGYGSALSSVSSAARTATTISGSQLDAIADESSRMNRLADQSNNATGVLQAQQAGNQINIELAQQIQKQRIQQMTQAQADNAAVLMEQQRRQNEVNAWQAMYGNKTVRNPFSDSGYLNELKGN